MPFGAPASARSPEIATRAITVETRRARLERVLALFLLACVVAIGLRDARAADSEPRALAARVGKSSGETRLMRPSALLTPLRVGEPIRAGDRVYTGADGIVELRFTDGAVVLVRPDSEFTVEGYRYDAQGESSLLALARGAIRTVTGAIGKRNHEDFRLSTPTATIGVRGTDFETLQNVCRGRGCLPGERPGLSVTVYKGRVAVSNSSGTTEVPEGATLYVRSAQEQPVFGTGEPRRLAPSPLPAPLQRQSPPPPQRPGAGAGVGPGVGAAAPEPDRSGPATVLIYEGPPVGQ